MKKIIAQRLKLAREKQKLSQVDVYNTTGINNKTLSGYENEVSSPDLETLKILAQVYKCSSDYLLGITDDPNTPEENIAKAISDDKELSEFWEELRQREDLQLLFKQTKSLSPTTIKRIIKYIKMVEDEEAAED